MRREGVIEVITGPMFSGKTTELIRRLTRAEIAGQKVKVFKPIIDDRYSEDYVGSHDGEQVEALVVENSKQLRNHVSEKDDVIAVDEANFFSPALVNTCQQLAYQGHRVIVSGTDQTFRGTPFDPLPSLMSVAEYVDKLRAVCVECGDPASMNQRINEDGKPAHVNETLIKVGGNEQYEARCRQCHELRGVE